MANLYTGTIESTQGEYANVETLTGLTFEDGITYTIQSYFGDYYLCEGSTGKGFYIEQREKVQFTYGGDDLNIKTFNGDVVLNIAD